MRIRPIEARDRAWAEQLVRLHFGSPRVVSRGVLHEPRLLPGLVAEAGEERVGLLQYRAEQGACEVVLLAAVRRREGIGTALMQAVRRVAEADGCGRVWLVTTNDNRAAQAFYEAAGMRRCAVYPGAVAASRKLKPEIPEYDQDGTPIRDEIEYEWRLSGA